MDQPIHLLDLPIEILSHIFLPLLMTLTNTPIPLCPCSSPSFTSPILPLLLIHPCLHAIICPLLYATANTFLLDLTGKHHPHIRRNGLFIGRDALRKIGRLVIKVDRLRKWIQDDIVPIVSDMTIHGQLLQLHLYLSVPFKPEALLRPPLSGLFALLTDPYLHSARLWVDADRGWPQVSDGGSQGCGADGDGLVEIDWRSVLDEADPDGDMFPVVAFRESMFMSCV